MRVATQVRIVPMGADDESGATPADADVPDEAGEDGEVEADTEHLDELPDGSGCAEVWEHVSTERDDGERDDGDGNAGAADGGDEASDTADGG
jgi:hypothetical protein